MQSASHVQLSLVEYITAVTVLRNVDSNLEYDQINAAYQSAIKLVSSIDHQTSVNSVTLWRQLTRFSVHDLILTVVAKELTQLKNNIDAQDSLVDFFGWLLVGKMMGLDIEQLLETLLSRL
jgi:uncharacterized membrane protein YjfL (UPF0719 family)